jgi:hypothetical protein
MYVYTGKDMTTQAIKDTQAIIDEKLGISEGLLQRCCCIYTHIYIHIYIYTYIH